LTAYTAYPNRDEAWVNVHHQEHALFTKGSLKISDPDHKLAHFFLLAEGQFHRAKTKTYDRWASHWIEDQQKIRENPVLLPDGSYVCFSKEAAKKVGKKSVSFQFNLPALGIDLRGRDSHGNPLTPPGAHTGTMMIMLLPDNTLGIKWEGFSASSMTNIHHGSIDKRIKENILHGRQYVHKLRGTKNSIASLYSPKLREDTQTSYLKKSFKHLYQYKKQFDLDDELIASLKLGKNKGNLPCGTSLLQFAYKVLDKVETAAISPDMKHDIISDATTIIHEIEALQKAQRINPWGAQANPRLGEVLLPSLSNMVST
jgi:hypothetical protein